MQAINIPAQVLGSVAWGGVNLDILFVTTYSSVRNFNTGETDKNFKFTNESGQVFMVNGLNARGVPGRPACVWIEENSPVWIQFKNFKIEFQKWMSKYRFFFNISLFVIQTMVNHEVFSKKKLED